MRQIDKFCELLDRLYKIDSVNKSTLVDIFHKSNPNSLKDMPNIDFSNYSVTKVPELTSTTNYTFNVNLLK